MTANPLPWTQTNALSVVKDANGALVSFHDHAAGIVRAVNFEASCSHQLETLLKAIAEATGPRATVANTRVLQEEAMRAQFFLNAHKEQVK